MATKRTIGLRMAGLLLMIASFVACNVMAASPQEAEVIIEGEIVKPGSATDDAVVMVRRMLKPQKPSPLQGYVGRTVQIKLQDPAAHRSGDSGVFFTRFASLGSDLRLMELSDDDNRGTVAVAAAERMLVEQANAQMRGMLEKAEHVVVGRVSSLLQIAAAPSDGVISEHVPQWQSAVIEVTEAIKGGTRTGDTLTVRFASSIDVMWYDAPKLTVDQQGIFVIGDGRVMSGVATLAPESAGDAGTLISPGQVLPLSERERVLSMLR